SSAHDGLHSEASSYTYSAPPTSPHPSAWGAAALSRGGTRAVGPLACTCTCACSCASNPALRAADEGGMLDHERRDVYQRAIELVAPAYTIGARLPRGHAPLADQLRRAATSIPLHVEEGAGKPGRRDRARFYGIAS